MSELFMLDKNSHIPIFSEICTFCRHLDVSGERRCAAFPQEIPFAIWVGENDHHRSFPGDHGIQFAPKLPSVAVPKSAKKYKRRVVVSARSAPIARLRSQIWQDLQARQQIVEIIKPKIAESQSNFVSLEHLPRVESIWLGTGNPVKGKSRRPSARRAAP